MTVDNFLKMDLDVLLQSYFATDEGIVQHLPAILDSLSPSLFERSAQFTKWTNRINALLHSKQPAPRWAGLVLAHQTSLHSREIMVDNAQGWISVALPIISVREHVLHGIRTHRLQRSEAVASQSAAIRLLCYICAKARESRDFQRQVVFPIVPKFSAAMVALAESSLDTHLKVGTLRSPLRHRSEYRSSNSSS